jgi:hypothetical protein
MPTDKALAVNPKPAMEGETTAADLKLKQLSTVRNYLSNKAETVIAQRAEAQEVIEKFRTPVLLRRRNSTGRSAS